MIKILGGNEFRLRVRFALNAAVQRPAEGGGKKKAIKARSYRS
jgi:hypothetical protein